MKTIKLSIVALAAMFAIASCSQNPKGDNAEVSDAKEAGAATGAELALAEGSVVTWIGTKPTGQHNGTIAVKSGSIVLDGENVTGGNIVIDLTNIFVEDLKDDAENSGKLVGHLKSADFFDVENNPEATFVITGATAYVADANNPSVLENPTHTISGNLTLRGTTLGISFPAIVHVMGDKVHAEAKFNIDRTKWGVSYGDEAKAVDKAKDFYISNTVNVGFNLTASK